MSAGQFVRSRYAATYDEDQVHPIRVQEETIAMALTGGPTITNSPPVASVTNPISAQVSRPARGLGLRPRKVNLELVGDPPEGYSEGSLVSLPVLNTTLFSQLTNGTSVTYLNTTWEVVSTDVESVR